MHSNRLKWASGLTITVAILMTSYLLTFTGQKTAKMCQPKDPTNSILYKEPESETHRKYIITINIYFKFFNKVSYNLV